MQTRSMFFSKKTISQITKDRALPGRNEAMGIAKEHFVLGSEMKGTYSAPLEIIYFGMGCFWGAERLFWQLSGVINTAVGYQGGFTPNPTYEEVCSGNTGHSEVVKVVFDPAQISLDDLLKTFWEQHDPTQGMAQGNDIGTQYRSAIYASDDAQLQLIDASRARFSDALAQNGNGEITTEISQATAFYFAEDYHQQYLAKNPDGYCGIGGTGITCPVPPK